MGCISSSPKQSGSDPSSSSRNHHLQGFGYFVDKDDARVRVQTLEAVNADDKRWSELANKSVIEYMQKGTSAAGDADAAGDAALDGISTSVTAPQIKEDLPLALAAMKHMKVFSSSSGENNVEDAIRRWQNGELTGLEVKELTKANPHGQKAVGMTFGKNEESIFAHFVEKPGVTPTPATIWYEDDKVSVAGDSAHLPMRADSRKIQPLDAYLPE